MNTKQIRQKILDLAIRGELVPQDPSDEPASVLLERIRAEKEQLIKDKKLKRDKKDNEPIDEVPFELPEGWVWCRLGEIGIWGSGITPSRNKKEYYDGNIPWLKTGDLNDSYIYETSELISDLAVKEYSLKKIPIGSILIAMYGATIAKLGLLEIEVTTNQACCACTPFSGIVNKFLFHYLFSQKQNIKNKAEGGAQPNISKEKLINFLFPLPPLAEQHRIVQKIEQLFALVDTIETHKEQLKALVKQAKNQVLNYAIAGKLTHQDPNDEPAEALLKRVGKTTATAADTPYEKLPKGWAWCRLGEVANIISGVSYNKKDISNNGIRILRGGNIQNSKVLILEDDIFISENYKNETNSVKIGDIVIVASTGSNLLIGKAGFIKKDLDNTQIGAFLRIIRPISDICSFLQLIFISDFYRTYIRDLAKGTNINNIKNEYLTEFIIPLPPLAEQHRIVQQIENYFTAFDQIENELA